MYPSALGVYIFFKKNYTILPYFLSLVNSSFTALMEILFSPSLYVLNIDLIVFPLFIPNTCSCRIDFFFCVC